MYDKYYKNININTLKNKKRRSLNPLSRYFRSIYNALTILKTKRLDNHFFLKTLYNVNIDENNLYINIDVDQNTRDMQYTLYIILYIILIFTEIAFNQH